MGREERKMSGMGFTAREMEQACAPAPFEMENALFTFDSGRHVSFADGLTHFIVLGTTGSGKTASLLMPALYRHIMAGHYGVIGDPKGNMGEGVYARALRAGREKDYLCVGTHPSATPLNYIEGMKPGEFYDFITTLTRKSFDSSSGNMDFVVKGLGMTLDCYQLLLYLAKMFDFRPTLETIEEMLFMYEEGSALFDMFKKNADPADREQQKFIRMVEATEYHPLNMNADKIKRLRDVGEYNHFMQLEYNLQVVRQALKVFLDTPGIREKFCAANAPGLNMDAVILSHQLLHLHLMPNSGSMGGQICRQILNRFYESVYRLGLQERPGQSFVCLDEFQEMADLSDARFSDTSFISQARQFNCAFLAATQSVSALQNRATNLSGVEALLANCNNKVILFSDDWATREIVKRYSPEVDAIDFRRGECFAITFDAATGNHAWSCEKVRGGYEYGQAVKPVSPGNGGAGERAPSLARLGDLFRERAAGNGGSLPGESSRVLCKGQGKQWLGKEINSENSTEKEKIMANGEMELAESGISRRDNDLAREFPALFEAGCQCVVPVGWRPYARRCLGLITAVQLEVTIVRIGISPAGELEAVCRRSGYAQAFLRKLFKKTATLCMECGREIENPRKNAPLPADPDDDEDESFYSREEDVPLLLCKSCLASFRLNVEADFRPC